MRYPRAPQRPEAKHPLRGGDTFTEGLFTLQMFTPAFASSLATARESFRPGLADQCIAAFRPKGVLACAVRIPKMLRSVSGGLSGVSAGHDHRTAVEPACATV
jgi:hypothetical protein